jgi:hypothetical protein
MDRESVLLRLVAKDTVLFVKGDLAPFLLCHPRASGRGGLANCTAPVKTKTSARIPSLARTQAHLARS